MRGRMGARLGWCRQWGRYMRAMRSWVSCDRLCEGRYGVVSGASVGSDQEALPVIIGWLRFRSSGSRRCLLETLDDGGDDGQAR